MRLTRSTSLSLRLLLLLLFTSALHGAVTVTLSAVPSTITDGQTSSLVALVTGASNSAVQWTFTPTVSGAVVGPAGGPDSTGRSTNSFKAPSPVTASFKVNVTVTSVQDPSQTDTSIITVNPVVDVGVGAPPNLVPQFQGAFFRDGFNFLVSLPPVATSSDSALPDMSRSSMMR